MAYRENVKGWRVEGARAFGPNVMRASAVAGNERWTYIGIYIPPSETDGETLHYLEDALLGNNDPCVLMGDLNACLKAPRDD